MRLNQISLILQYQLLLWVVTTGALAHTHTHTHTHVLILQLLEDFFPLVHRHNWKRNG